MKIVNCLTLSLLLLCALSYIQGYSLRYNRSDSLPQILYLATPADAIQLSQIVTFRLPASQVTFAKIVVGLPGDSIEVRNQKLFINGHDKGDVLEHLKPIKNGVIPEGFYFVMGKHPRSFDSRYADFGLIPQASIREKLCPIF